MWRRTKKGVIHSWVNGDLDEDGVSFSFNSTPLFGLSAPVLYFVEDGLGDSDSDNDSDTHKSQAMTGMLLGDGVLVKIQRWRYIF